MRAELRCKEHHQGDRCKLERGHDKELAHIGNFTAWTDDKNMPSVPLYEKKAARRSRFANRNFRIICAKNFNPHMLPGADRKPFIWILGQLAKHFKGRAQ